MYFNRNINHQNQESDPDESLPELLKHFEGCVVVGYLKGSRKKHVMLVSGDDACNDGISYFIPAIESWMQLGPPKDNDDQ